MKRVGFVRGIATSYVWRRRISVVAEEKECVAVDSSCLELGATTQRGSMVALVAFVVAVSGGVKGCAVRERFRSGWSSASGVTRSSIVAVADPAVIPQVALQGLPKNPPTTLRKR